jgi:iron complex transport system substrate-binding protein
MAKPIISPEYILEQNPDFLFGAMAITSAEDILNSNPLISETRAGSEGNIYLVPSYKILRPTPRVIDFIEELYEQLRDLSKQAYNCTTGITNLTSIKSPLQRCFL